MGFLGGFQSVSMTIYCKKNTDTDLISGATSTGITTANQSHCCYFSSSDESSELEILMDGRKGGKYREESLNIPRGINQTWSGDDNAIQLCIKMKNHQTPNF